MPRRVPEPEDLTIKSLDESYFDDEALPPGIIFTDVLQKKWRLGKPIGRGSFGRIYLASDETENEVTKYNARYVVKIEPHSNGPLFVEVHCLIRTAQVSKVKAWCQQQKLKRLGMPLYIASGSFIDESTKTKYRFLILPRYDIDLQKVISKTKVLDLRNVLLITLQILDVLEYLHNQGYTHSDIKSSNLMLGFDGNKFNKNKPAPSFQKDTKFVLLSRKLKTKKNNKSRTSNYYDDEDFIFKDRSSTEISELDDEKRLASVKKKLRKILSDKDNRTLHRHHAFNLRQLSSYVNYEDLNSSVCSDRSYQKLLDDFGNKNNNEETQNNKSEDIEIQKEAIYSQSNGQIYLLDYGLASKFLDAEGKHKDFGMDARKAHDGTLEYSSRDSHIGAHSRRSDLETLGYNILDWLTGKLPWKTPEVLSEPDLVHAIKKNFMTDTKTLLRTCFKSEFYPQFLDKYFQYVTTLDFTEKPDYEYCRSLFKSEILRNNFAFDKDLSVNFAEISISPNRKLCYTKKFGRKNTPADFIVRNGIKKTYERENVFSLENDLKLELLKQTLNTSTDGIRKPCTSRNFFISDADLVARLKKSLMPHDMFGKKLSPKNLRSKKKPLSKRKGVKRHRNSIGKFGKFMGSAKQFSWAEILAGNPEDIIRKERNANTGNDEDNDDAHCRYRIRKLSNASSDTSETNLQSPLLQKDYLQDMNPTYAMREVIANLKKRIAGKNIKDVEEINPTIEGYTPAMIKVYIQKEKNKQKDLQEDVKNPNTDKKAVLPTRCTRSMANKTKLKEPETKNNKKTVSHKIDTKEVVTEKEEIVGVRPKNNNDKKNKKMKSTLVVSKKSVSVIDNTDNTIKPKKPMKRATEVPINRRRLRSSKRKNGTGP